MDHRRTAHHRDTETPRMRRVLRASAPLWFCRCRGLLLTALVAVSASCGDVVRQGRSPVYLVIDQLSARQGQRTEFGGTLTSDVLTNVTTPAPCTPESPCPTIFNDIGQVTLHIDPKNLLSSPTATNAVTIRRYRVTYVRADGRNVSGVDVPYAFDGAVTGTVSPGGQLVLSFEIVRHVAKEESPLVQLVTSPTVITTLAQVTFYGADQAGNEVSVVGNIQIDFGNFGD